MTGGVAGTQPIPGTNPMIALQRRAFGFGGSATTAQLAIAVVGPIAAMLICWGRFHGLVITAAVLIPTPVLLALQAVRERANWTAQDVLGWLDHEAAVEWRDAAGTAMPRNSAAAAAWLAGHVEVDVPADCWAAALLMAGRVDEARDRIASLLDETPARVHRRLDLQLAADSTDGRVVDSEEADNAVRDDPDATAATRAAHLGYHTSVAAVSRGTDGLAALAAARPAIGRLPVGLTIRLLVIRFRFAAISILFGAWLLVAVLVGLATSGGVVWF
jgi:hypothetical protein